MVRSTNLDDFVIGTPILNRLDFADKNTNGMFISTVPLRVNILNDSSFVDFSKSMARSCLSMLRHQRYPYQNILEDLRKLDSSIPNLYNVVLSYQITNTVNDEIVVILIGYLMVLVLMICKFIWWITTLLA